MKTHFPIFSITLVFLLTSPLASFANPAAASSPIAKSQKSKPQQLFVTWLTRAPQFWVPDAKTTQGSKAKKIRPPDSQLKGMHPQSMTQAEYKSDFIHNSGTFPPGSLMVYDKKSHFLMMKNTKENNELFLAVFGMSNSGKPLIGNLKIAVVKYELKDNEKPIAATIAPIAVSEFQKRLKKPMQLLETVNLVTRFDGSDFQINRTTGSDGEEKRGTDFEPGETGIKATGYGSKSVGGNYIRLQCHYRGKIQNHVMDFVFKTKNRADLKLKNGVPTVVYTAKIPDAAHKNKTSGIAFIVTAETINLSGKPTKWGDD